MWQTIQGILQPGHRVASGTAEDSPYPLGSIEMQIPFFQAQGLDLTSYYRGTLNVSISPVQFEMKDPQYTFRDVKWSAEHPAEDFSFSACWVIFRDFHYEGWVYYPRPETKLRHFQDASTLEVITFQIPGIAYGDALLLTLKMDEIGLNV